jgi:hypothetical protein
MWTIKRKTRPSFRQPIVVATSSNIIDENVRSLPPPPEKDVEFGATVAVKTFYAGKGSAGGTYNWVDSLPKALSKKAVKANDRVCYYSCYFCPFQMLEKTIILYVLYHRQENEKL